ncbi:hypothetical protein X975_23163, partial [Stegodyphus mimosarum]
MGDLGASLYQRISDSMFLSFGIAILQGRSASPPA